MKKIAVTAGLIGCTMMMGGCALLNKDAEWEPQQSSAISIGEDGTITEYVNDKLDEDYYSASELQTMIEAEVREYNGQNGENSVVMKEFKTEGKDVHLTMEYAAAEDYAQFNHTEFYYGSMINAQIAGYLFDVTYNEIENGTVAAAGVSGTEVLKNMAAEVMVVTAPLEVIVPGNVIFTSENAEMVSSNDVNASGTEKESSASDKEKSFHEKAAEKRVYIIFEME